MNRTSYASMWSKYGYGTLIVGLPLWFATMPADPLRVENVIDDFVTRVSADLKPYVRQLKQKTCPFWRIVVVWMVSLESLREIRGKARFDVYDDPANRRISNLPIEFQSLLSLQAKAIKMGEEARRQGGKAGGSRLFLAVSAPRKKGDQAGLRLTPVANALRQLDHETRTRVFPKPLDRLRWRALQRAMEVLCFVRIHSQSGLRRWAATKLSPRSRISRWARSHQARRLYRASRHRRDATSRR